ncbi:hypothetical protein [Kitasatospora sp. NPDC056731]|uniref:hypothetical protein n=1 Tax=Kitasatospora sp. NPDC056731 TaxID=3155422 RepID=UPI0034186517
MGPERDRGENVMLGFVVRRPRGRRPLAAAAPLLSALPTGRRRRDVATRLRHVEEM